MFSERAIRLIAEQKILTAITEGEFDDLPGFGQPSALMDEPYDPHWWIRRKLQTEQIRVDPREFFRD